MKVFKQEYDAAIKYVQENNPAAQGNPDWAKDCLDGLLHSDTWEKYSETTSIASGGFRVVKDNWWSLNEYDLFRIEISHPAFGIDDTKTFEV